MWFNCVEFITDLEISASGSQEATVFKSRREQLNVRNERQGCVVVCLGFLWVYIQGRAMIVHTVLFTSLSWHTIMMASLEKDHIQSIILTQEFMY